MRSFAFLIPIVLVFLIQTSYAPSKQLTIKTKKCKDQKNLKNLFSEKGCLYIGDNLFTEKDQNIFAYDHVYPWKSKTYHWGGPVKGDKGPLYVFHGDAISSLSYDEPKLRARLEAGVIQPFRLKEKHRCDLSLDFTNSYTKFSVDPISRDHFGLKSTGIRINGVDPEPLTFFPKDRALFVAVLRLFEGCGIYVQDDDKQWHLRIVKKVGNDHILSHIDSFDSSKTDSLSIDLFKQKLTHGKVSLKPDGEFLLKSMGVNKKYQCSFAYINAAEIDKPQREVKIAQAQAGQKVRWGTQRRGFHQSPSIGKNAFVISHIVPIALDAEGKLGETNHGIDAIKFSPICNDDEGQFVIDQSAELYPFALKKWLLNTDERWVPMVLNARMNDGYRWNLVFRVGGTTEAESTQFSITYEQLEFLCRIGKIGWKAKGQIYLVTYGREELQRVVNRQKNLCVIQETGKERHYQLDASHGQCSEPVYGTADCNYVKVDGSLMGPTAFYLWNGCSLYVYNEDKREMWPYYIARVSSGTRLKWSRGFDYFDEKYSYVKLQRYFSVHEAEESHLGGYLTNAIYNGAIQMDDKGTMKNVVPREVSKANVEDDYQDEMYDDEAEDEYYEDEVSRLLRYFEKAKYGND